MMKESAFQVSILASGSSGNSLYIESNKKRILVDAGLSGKKITSLLDEVGRKPEDLDAILVTHEHRDHIHGVGSWRANTSWCLRKHKNSGKAMDKYGRQY